MNATSQVKEGRRVWDNIVRLLMFNLPVGGWVALGGMICPIYERAGCATYSRVHGCTCMCSVVCLRLGAPVQSVRYPMWFNKAQKRCRPVPMLRGRGSPSLHPPPPPSPTQPPPSPYLHDRHAPLKTPGQLCPGYHRAVGLHPRVQGVPPHRAAGGPRRRTHPGTVFGVGGGGRASCGLGGAPR